ncbi:hypothetical protein LEN26_014543, partial [Aphanomyces euteiches]
MAEIQMVKHRLPQDRKMMILRIRAYFLNEAAKPSREKKKKVRRVVAEYSRIGVMLTEEIDDMLGIMIPTTRSPYRTPK